MFKEFVDPGSQMLQVQHRESIGASSFRVAALLDGIQNLLCREGGQGLLDGGAKSDVLRDALQGLRCGGLW